MPSTLVVSSLGSPAGRIDSAHALTALDRVYYADRAWSVTLDDWTQGDIRDDDLDAAATAADVLADAIVALPEALRPAREMLNGADSDGIEAAVRALLGPERASELADELGEASFRGAAVIALDELIDGAYQDADDVRAQRAAVASGETPDSEKRRRKKCLAALANSSLPERWSSARTGSRSPEASEARPSPPGRLGPKDAARKSSASGERSLRLTASAFGDRAS